MVKKKKDEQRSAMGERLNVLRAGVLGSNDGILPSSKSSFLVSE